MFFFLFLAEINRIEEGLCRYDTEHGQGSCGTCDGFREESAWVSARACCC